MQNKSLNKFWLILCLPVILSVFLILSVGGVSVKTSTSVSASTTNPIKVSLVTVNDIYSDTEYDASANTPSIINTDISAQSVTYDGTNINFVMLNNSYPELQNGEFYTNGNYTELSGAYTINKADGVFSSVEWNGGTYERDSLTKKIPIGLTFYFFDAGKNKVYEYPNSHQALHLNLGDSTTSYQTINATIKLNGQEISRNENIVSGNYQYFQQFFHGLTSSTVNKENFHTSFNTKSNIDSTPLEVVEGLYEISIDYRDAGSNPKTEHFKFYLVTSDTYANEAESVNFSWTQKKFSTEQGDTYAVEHFFNQTNIGTTMYDDTEVTPSEEKLIFPTVQFNPEKYQVAYKRVLYNYNETGAFSFETTNDALTEGKLTLTIKQNNVTISTETKRLTRESVNKPFIAEWAFEDLGDYEFYKNCMIKTGKNSYKVDTSGSIAVSDSLKSLLKTEALYLNGFQAIYADGGKGENYLRNEQYNSDFTFLNDSIPTISKPASGSVNIGTNSITMGSNTLNFNNSLSFTNQPPIWMKYNATLNNTANSSWYIFTDKQGVIKIKDYKYAERFEDPGKYFVLISFKDKSKPTNSWTQQFIAFEIINTPPTASIQATDREAGSDLVDSSNVIINDLSTAISNEGYTNKNVYITWDKAGPFNASIYAVYSQKNYNTNTAVKNKVSFNGLVRYYENEAPYGNSNTTIFTENSEYTIEVFWSNSKESSITLSFIIDKSDISGIMALGVNASTKQLNNTSTFTNNILSQNSEDGFNLITNQPFAWTWEDKTSGSPITAKWCWSSLTSISDYNLPELIANTENQEWVLANGQFGLLTPLSNYAYTKVNATNFKTTNFSTSQIVSTSRMCILVLSDTAGNTATFVTILDNIAPEFIQKEAGAENATPSTIISKTTQITWGTHKALSVRTDEQSNDVQDLIASAESEQSWTFGNETFSVSDILLNALNTYFKENSSNNLFYTSNIERSTIQFESANQYSLSPTLSGSTWTNTSIWVVVKKNADIYQTYISSDYNHGTQIGTPYNNMTPIQLSDGLTMTPQGVTINVYDRLNNQRSRTKQISLDKSQGSMFSHSGSVSNDGVSNTTDVSNEADLDDKTKTNRKQLFNNNSTNRDFATFSFLQQSSGIFRVKAITLDFYALIYDVNAENYPYSDIPLSSTLYGESNTVNWNEITLEEVEGAYYHSSALKPTGTGISQAGKYVVTRTYVDEFDSVTEADEQDGDVNNLQYTFFVDRTGIIALNKSGEYLTGEDFSLVFGLDSYGSKYSDETAKTFKDFAKQAIVANEFVNNFKVSTTSSSKVKTPTSFVTNSNILPSKIALELIDGVAYKYKGTQTTDDGEIVVYNTENTNMHLMVVVQQFSTTSMVKQSLFTSAINQADTKNNVYPISQLSSQTFNAVGGYRVMLMDASNLTGGLSGTWSDLMIWQHHRFVPNHTIFSFEVTNKMPEVNAVVHSASLESPYSALVTSNKVLDSQGDMYLTSNNNVILTFSDTTDEYRAKIAYNDVILMQTPYYLDASATSKTGTTSSITISGARLWDESDSTAMSETFSETEISRIKGEYSGELLTSLTLSTKEQNNGILYYKELLEGTTDRYVYYILLPSVTVYNGFKTDCLYTLNYHFIGDRETYKEIINNTDGTTTFSYATYEGSTKTYIDHTAPYKNLVSLVNNDTYLTTAQKTDILANINNPNYEFLQNYAFAVGPDFFLEGLNDTENSSEYYYQKYPNGKYSGVTYQTAVPGSYAYDNNTSPNKFSNLFAKLPYRSMPAESGYYDIIEVDKSNNYRVYSIYLNKSAVELYATGTDESTAENETQHYTFTTGFDISNTPVYSISLWQNEVSETLYEASGKSTSTQAVISAYSFNLQQLNITDAWYTIKYRLQNGNNSQAWNTITITPYSDVPSILSTLNTFIQESIASGKLSQGCKMEFVINNRAGNDIRFFLQTPGVAISLQNLAPTKIGSSSFSIVLPADTFSTQYSNFSVKRNGVTPVSEDSNGKKISDTENNRTAPQSFVFRLDSSTKYTFEWTDNFGKKYYFVYPTTSNLVNEITYAEGSNPQVYNGIVYTPNDTKFRYTSTSIEKVSLTVTNQISQDVLISFNNLPYSSTESGNQIKDLLSAAETYSAYFSLSKVGHTVTINFKSVINTHYTYEIQFTDIDNNKTSHIFGIYSFTPIISLTDTSGVPIWSAVGEKATSKTVVARWTSDSEILFNPRVEVIFNSATTTTITSPYIMNKEGSYTIRVVNNLGVINSQTIQWTIKPATSSVYGVYFKEALLEAHTEHYVYTSGEKTEFLKQYFFLSNSLDAFEKEITIIPNEDNGYQIEHIDSDGRTLIYKIFNNTYSSHFAVTQIYSSNNYLTTFGIHTYTNQSEPTPSSVIGAGESSLRLSPDAAGNATYAEIRWTTSYTDTSNGKSYENFVYLYVVYNDTISMGKYTGGTLNLTKSGKYTIQVHDIVGQNHRFGSSTSTTTFTLTLLNDIIYYVNNESPIDNATYNGMVTLSLADISNYNWSQTGTIKVWLNNKLSTDYEQIGNIWRFTLAGFYKVELSTTTATGTPITIKGNLTFTIVDSNESRSVFEFAKISGYTVESVQKIGYDDNLGQDTYSDITEQLKALTNSTNLHNFTLSMGTVGAGKYLVTINTKAGELVPGQRYSFIVWVNSEAPTLHSSRAWGTSETSAVTITYNPSLIYQQVGNSVITLNGEVKGNITSGNQSQTDPVSFDFSKPGTYLVQVYSASGTLLSSQRITITVPFNTASIILIIVASLVVVGIIITFVILRTRMKVK